jgi:hypothetical protein
MPDGLRSRVANPGIQISMGTDRDTSMRNPPTFDDVLWVASPNYSILTGLHIQSMHRLEDVPKIGTGINHVRHAHAHPH